MQRLRRCPLTITNRLQGIAPCSLISLTGLLLLHKLASHLGVVLIDGTSDIEAGSKEAHIETD